MALQRFIPTSPDVNIRSGQDLEGARFGHLNAIVEYINNNTVLPAGLNGYVQFNDNNALGGDPGLFWDNINKRLGVGTTTPLGILHLKSTAATTRMVIDGDAGQSKIITYRTAGLQRFDLYVNNIAETGSNAGSNFAISAYSDAGTLLNTPLSINRASGQVTFDERVKLESDSTVTTQTSAVIQSSTANASLVIAPNGTGALIANIPDGTITGGNARGQYAVDLQMIRDSNLKVAGGAKSVITGGQWNGIDINSGLAFIGGGYFNRIDNAGYAVLVGGSSNYINGGSGFFHTIVGGSANTTGGGGGGSFIGGGLNNNATGAGAGTISGGANNTASSNYSTISGGQSNTASTGTHTTVVGGQSNVASGQHSVAGGLSNTASGAKSFCFGNLNASSGIGVFNFNGQPEGSTITGNYAVNLSGGATTISAESGFSTGYNNNVSALGATAFGSFVRSYLRGQFATNNAFMFGSDRGSSQQSNLTASKQAALASNATTVLSLDGTGVTALIIPEGNNRLWAVKITATAFVSVAGGTLVLGDSYMGEYTLLFKKVGGVSSVVGVSSGNIIFDANMGSAAFTFAAGASQDLQITFKAPTTASATTFRCVARVELTEVAY